MKINDLLQVYSIGYATQDVKTVINHDFKVNVSNITIDGKQGEVLNLPRWVSQTLESEKHAEIQESDMGVELTQSISKENFQGEELSHIDPDFYIRVTGYIARQSDKEKDKLESLLKTLIRKRLGKLIPMANSMELTADMAKKLSIEERALYNQVHEHSTDFVDQIFGER
ncbi:MAG: DNA replication complex GINS family protein [Candidatus Nitrosotenuis sp.]|uniref:DNA replication complex GINS family protein n=1 Tax=Candidatus Nitrosotenuis cloacae TaxID=1603555 RepID=UPI00227DD3CD|nr:DNA replication complex GINS family protein [Candidatus Nitrosotenuis cloacae]MDC8438327.1 DNA replication complex GINS family protein [Candidatus Nitrosotenuis sp.]